MEEWERSVWERVTQPGREPEFPRELLQEARLLAAEYKGLGLRRLYGLQSRAVALLQGIGALSGERPLPGKVLTAGGGSREKRLLRCYHRCRQLMKEYALRGALPETGMLYQQLEGLAREQCVLLTALLGGG